MKLVLLLWLFPFFLCAQESKVKWPALSPKQTIHQVIGNTNVSISYERPAIRGRVIFGDLVPYGKVWRTGAGYCTKFHFDRPVKVEKQPVPAGTYSLFSIPNLDNWTIILNADTTLYGSGHYSPEKDIVRFTVPVKESKRKFEALTIDIDFMPNNGRVFISWDHTQVSFQVETSTDQEIEDFIKNQLLTGIHQVADDYAMAADYCYFKNEDLNLGIKLAKMSIALDPNVIWVYRLMAEMQEKSGQYQDALKTIDQCIMLIKKKGYDDEKYRVQDIAAMEKRKLNILAKM